MKVKVNTSGLHFRQIKTGVSIPPLLRFGDVVDVLTIPEVAKQRISRANTTNNDNVWLEVRRADGQEGICSARYVVEEIPQVDKVLVGLHGPSDPDYWPWPAAYGAIMTGKIEAVKLLTPGHSSQVVNQLKAIPSVKFIMARLFSKFEYPKSPKDFTREILPGMTDLVNAGVTYFEIHNEPNLHLPGTNPEGMWINWKDGREFADWFRVVYYELKSKFGDSVKLGFPGLSPGAYYIHNGRPARADSNQFLEEASSAVSLADWLGMHIYWNNQLQPQYAVSEINKFCSKYPHKDIYITEISNSDVGVSPETKGSEYKWVVRQRFPANLKAMFFYTASASSDPRRESWVGTKIPEIIGGR